MTTRSPGAERHPAVSRRLLLTAGLSGVLTAVTAGPVAASGEGEDCLRSLFGSENRVLRTRERVVALSFNAAWNTAGLDRVLGELARRSAPAVFFLTGDFADRHPEAVRRIAAAGHGLGNHSYSHPHFTGLSAAAGAREVRAADRALRRAGAGRALTPFFRFPYSETTPAHLHNVNELGFADIEFTKDTNGWMGSGGGMTVDRAVGRVREALRPGAIVEMHVGAADGGSEVIDARALPLILDGVTARGYRVVDLRTLLTAPCVTSADRAVSSWRTRRTHQP
ncbi:polysaccharide deacetylase family protein [Streptomyces sp. NPDC127190]|uniref:polysaccharide deacetylase family protein n=1 Tax=unclassified Streptomyces TaxID=2593676 RepID=UPI00362FD6D9